MTDLLQASMNTLSGFIFCWSHIKFVLHGNAVQMFQSDDIDTELKKYKSRHDVQSDVLLVLSKQVSNPVTVYTVWNGNQWLPEGRTIHDFNLNSTACFENFVVLFMKKRLI